MSFLHLPIDYDIIGQSQSCCYGDPNIIKIIDTDVM